MKILIYSRAFNPSVGGLEFMAEMLAEEFTVLGHDVLVATMTEDPVGARFGFGVARRPSAWALINMFRWSEIVLHMNVSLRGLWPFAIVRRPLVVVHHGFYRREAGRLGLRDRLKYVVSRFVTNVACSEAVKADLPRDTVVIGNAYNEAIFSSAGENRRDRDLVFVGRLVSEKGADLLLESLGELRGRGLRPTLTIVGVGPEEARLRALCRQREFEREVTFHGMARGPELAALLNRHRVLVVPSRNEGFGVVALEGIASGCVIVASDAGGLPEAVGDCGMVFPRSDIAALTRSLAMLLADEALLARYRIGRERHLQRFSRRNVALQYVKVLAGAVRRAHGG